MTRKAREDPEELLERFPLFNVPYKTPQHIGGVKDGAVYRISDDLVAKVTRPFSWQYFVGHGYLDNASWVLSRLENEAEIGHKLYEAGISVPRPEGTFKIDLNVDDKAVIRVPGFVMEFINGVNGMTFTKDEAKFARLMRRYLGMIRKTERLGFLPKDVRPFNFLYIAEEDKIVLIDFASWEYVR